MPALTLIPLNAIDHTDLLQAVYNATPAYWKLYHKNSAPEAQAAHDLAEAEATPGRTMMGVLVPLGGDTQFRIPNLDAPDKGMEMVGVLDIRQHYPGRTTTTIGMIMIAENWQRQGVGTGAVSLMEGFFARAAGMHKLRLAVEQFNPGALQFFQSAGFRVTGESARTKIDDAHVRLLYMEKMLDQEGPVTSDRLS